MITDKATIEAARRLCEELDKGGVVITNAARAEAITAIRGVIALANFGRAVESVAAPTRNGIWCPYSEGSVGDPVNVANWRRDGGVVRFTAEHFGCACVSNDNGWFASVRWVPYRAPRVAT